MPLYTIDVLTEKEEPFGDAFLPGEFVSIERLASDPNGSAYRMELLLESARLSEIRARLEQRGTFFRIREDKAFARSSWLRLDMASWLERRRPLPLTSESALKNRIESGFPDIGDLSAITKNRIGLLSDGRGRREAHEALPCLERDAYLLLRYAKMEALPLWIAADNDEDFIKSAVALAPNFSYLRLSLLNTEDPIQLVERIREQLSIPVVHAEYTETALLYTAALLNVLERLHLSLSKKTIAILGVDVTGMGLLELLLSFGPARVLGVDADFRKLARFEKREGLASSLENIYKNADIVLITPDYRSPVESKQFQPGQVILDFSGEGLVDAGQKPGAEKRIFAREIPHPVLVLPGLFLALRASGVHRPSKEQLLRLLDSLTENLSGNSILPLPNKALFEKQSQAFLQ